MQRSSNIAMVRRDGESHPTNGSLRTFAGSYCRPSLLRREEALLLDGACHGRRTSGHHDVMGRPRRFRGPTPAESPANPGRMSQ